jgi:hypothetical protein
MRILPNNRHEWIRLAFFASEIAAVGGVTCRLAVLVLFVPWQYRWQQNAVSEHFYRFNCGALLALAISTIAVSLSYPRLAALGCISIALGGPMAGFYPAVD